MVEARHAAVQALRFSRSESALPALLEALGDEDKSVREGASMALSPYDTEATVRALIGAAEGKEMVQRIIIDLRGSRRPEAREFLIGFLKSEDPKLREMAARSFYKAIFEGDPVTLELHRLAADPDLAVRVSAIEALHKSPLAETVGVLLGVLRREGLTPRELRAAVQSLGESVERVRFRKGSLDALRSAQDLPALMSMVLSAAPERGLPPLGFAAVRILSQAGTEEARALLGRVKAGDFGPSLVDGASKALERMAAR
jgi:HEAT repeat protein